MPVIGCRIVLSDGRNAPLQRRLLALPHTENSNNSKSSNKKNIFSLKPKTVTNVKRTECWCFELKSGSFYGIRNDKLAAMEPFQGRRILCEIRMNKVLIGSYILRDCIDLQTWFTSSYNRLDRLHFHCPGDRVNKQLKNSDKKGIKNDAALTTFVEVEVTYVPEKDPFVKIVFVDSSEECLYVGIDLTSTLSHLKQQLKRYGFLHENNEEEEFDVDFIHSRDHSKISLKEQLLDVIEKPDNRLLLRRTIRLNIRIPQLNDSISVDIHPDNTVEMLRKMITEKKSVLLSGSYRLMFAGRELESDKTLSSYNIGNNCSLFAFIPQSRRELPSCVQTVYIRTLDHDTIDLRIESIFTVEMVKQMLNMKLQEKINQGNTSESQNSKQRTQIHANNHHYLLSFNGMILENIRSLSRYHIGDDATLVMIAQPQTTNRIHVTIIPANQIRSDGQDVSVSGNVNNSNNNSHLQTDNNSSNKDSYRTRETVVEGDDNVYDYVDVSSSRRGTWEGSGKMSRTIVLQVTSATSILQVKQMIWDREGIPVIDQHLFGACRTSELTDSRRICDFDIVNNTNLTLLYTVPSPVTDPVSSPNKPTLPVSESPRACENNDYSRSQNNSPKKVSDITSKYHATDMTTQIHNPLLLLSNKLDDFLPSRSDAVSYTVYLIPLVLG